MKETDRIKKRYQARLDDDRVRKNLDNKVYNRYIINEREKIYEKIIRSKFKDLSDLKFIEIGAGEGYNLPFFHELGIPWENIHANELIPERVQTLKSKFQAASIYDGDASELRFDSNFDIVFQSTVFTSILDDALRIKLARKMFRMARDGGLILWYDFAYNNPSNKDVKKVTKSELVRLFPGASNFIFYPVTLAPPIGRLIGNLYPFFNTITFLRTHIICAITK